MSKKTSSSGVNMDQLQHNFKKYQYKGTSQNTAKPSSTTSKPSAASTYKDNYKTNLQNELNFYSNTNNQDNRKLSSNTVDNDILQNAGNKEDWTTNIGDDNSISNSNIGNDYSVNIGGINNGGGGSGGSYGLNNMQGAAAYTALNNNQHQRSKSELNGVTRAQQAIAQSNAATGAYDSAANLYNTVGMQQNYWSRKSDAQQNFYLGDIFAMKAPPFQGGGVNPSNPMDGDKTEDIMDDFKDSL